MPYETALIEKEKEMLTSKQRAQLRAMANGLSAIFQIGKEGVTENLIRGVDEALEKRELVKISILENSPSQAKESMERTSKQVHAATVQCTGRRLVVYCAPETDSPIEPR